MSIYRPFTRISGTAAAGANFSIPAATGRTTLLIGTDGLGRWVVSSGGTSSVLAFVGGGNANSPNLYLTNVMLGRMIEGSFTVNNAHTATMTFAATWTIQTYPST